MPTISDLIAIGVQHHQDGRLDLAEQFYREILASDPDQFEAWRLLGVISCQLQKYDIAYEYITRSLQINPDNALAHGNLGVALQRKGLIREAIGSYRRSIELQPSNAIAYDNLGSAFQELSDYQEAIDHHQRAIDLQPGFAEAHNNLGNALRASGKLDEAAHCYGRALELKPDLAEAYSNLGNVVQVQGKLDEAIAYYRRALEISPDSASAQSNLGTAVKDQGNVDEAIGCFRRALALNPDFGFAWGNLLYALYFSPAYDASAIYEEHRRWNEQQAAPLAKFIEPHRNVVDVDRRLRVGYVSANFRSHAEAFFLAPLFSAHDRKQFEIVCYSDVVTSDEMTAKLRSCSGMWRTTCGHSDKEVAQMVREDKIDILVDLSMHMGGGRPLLFARKPAPVQVCWLAYQGTTGLATMDYRLTDPHLDPPGLFDKLYSEESVRLPDSFWCYDPLTNEPGVNALPAIENGFITFGSLNNFCKVNDDVLRLWSRVLRAVDGSKLLLLTGDGSHRQRTLEFLEAEGILRERIAFSRSRPRPDFLKLHQQIDIGLDTFPYNGQTTTLDALWMGVPVVTIVGQTSAARAGASILRNLGTPEWVANSPDEFVSTAVDLANDIRRLTDFRATLRKRLEQSPLMDAPRFARNVEAAYRRVWQRWCRSLGGGV